MGLISLFVRLNVLIALNTRWKRFISSETRKQALAWNIGHIDRTVKGLEAGDPWRVLQNIFLHLSGSEVIKSARVV